MEWLKKLLKIKEERTGAEVILYTGLPGGGKSVMEVLNFALPHLLNGEKVFACLWINWSGDNFKYFPPTEDGFKEIQNERNCCIMFDELAQIWDPRQYNNESREVRAFWQLHRHRHVDACANTQDVSLIAKTVGIVGSTFIQVEKIEESWVVTWFRDLIGLEKRIGLIKRYMSFKELKKESYGFDLEYSIEERGDKEIIWLKMSDIIRPDLDEYKIETIHRYCKDCCARQGEQIKKEDNEKVAYWTKTKKNGYWKLINDEYCPKHKNTLLELRLSGMYDTDYEPEVEKKAYKTKEFKICDCGFDHLVK